MKKNGGTKNKNVTYYKESPWGEDDPVIGEFVTGLLPPQKIIKKSKAHVLRDPQKIPLKLKDNERLKKQAAKAGLSPEALMAGIVHDFLQGRLAWVEK